MAAGSIIIDLLMKTGSFETDTKRAEKALANFKKQAADIGKVVGGAFLAMGAAVATGVKQSIDLQDEMLKASQKVGVSVEALSSMGYAADLAGVAQESLNASLVRLSKGMSDASQGTGEALKAFTALGISFKTTNGELRSGDQVMLDIAERFAAMEDSAGKTALAVALFGKAGAELIPFLNQGKEGIAGLQEEADRLGITLSTDAAKAAEVFNDNMTRLGAVSRGIFNEISKQLLPSLVNLTDEMFNTAQGSSALAEAASVAVTGIKLIASAALAVGGVFKVVGNQIGGFAASLVQLFSGNFQAAFDITAQRTVDFVDDITQTFKSVGALWDEPAARIESQSGDIAKKIAAPIIKAEGETGKAAKKMFENVEKSIRDIQTEVAKLEMTDVEAKLFDLQIAGASPEQLERAREALLILEEYTDKQERFKAMAEEAEKPLKRLHELMEDTPTAGLEKAREDMKLLADAYLKGTINLEQYTEAVNARLGRSHEETADKVTEFWEEAAANMQDAMGTFFFDAMQGKMGDFGDSFKNMIDRMVSELLASQLLEFAKGAFNDAGGAGGIMDFFSGFFNAKGNAFTSSGVAPIPFASGGIVDGATPFTFGGGRTGVMGEAGPEAIIPLKRGADGKLGVGGGVSVVNNFSIAGTMDSRTQAQIAAEVGQSVNRALARNT